jgi:iron(III) transport system ATP-binding protein
MSELNVKNLVVRFGDVHVLNKTNLTLIKGSCGVLVGTTGCGKTTLLRAIAGLQTRDEGLVRWNAEILPQPEERLIPGQPDIKLVTQDFELLPMLSAYEHIYQSAAVWGEVEKAKIANRLLRLFGLKKVADAPVRILSGGQQQRVALAKNLASDASLYLFDEAFSQLDLATRAEIMRAVKTYIKNNSKTALFVVHDPLDAFYLADKMFVLNKGRIAQSGSPQDVFSKPKSFAVAKLFGITNKLPKDVADEWFPKNTFHTIGQNAIFRPHEVQVKNIMEPFEIIDEVAIPRGKLLQLRIVAYKIWVEA